MTKRLISFIILLIIGLGSLINSVISIKNEATINLKNAQFINGEVLNAETRQIVKGGIRWKTYKRIFYFRLHNSNQNFAVYRSYEGYEDLKTKITIGDTVEVYYSGKNSGYNENVYQVEKNGEVLADLKEYKKNSSILAGKGLLLGIVLTVGSILWYMKFDLLKFMTNLVER